MKKKKQKSAEVDFGSYSDLFMVMAFVFLFMYVVSSLNTGITVIIERHRSEKEKKDLTEKVAQYEKKVDENLTEEQKAQFAAITEGLEKMKEETRLARAEQERLTKLAEQKEKELEAYQKSVKNFAITQARTNETIKQKENLLEKVTLEKKEQNRTIASLEETVAEKSSELTTLTKEVERRETEISKIQGRVEELSSKAKLASQQAVELGNLKSELAVKEKELSSVKSTVTGLAQEKENLAKASAEEIENLKATKNKEISSLTEKYKEAKSGLRREIASSIAGSLKAKGISADVDAASGDVTVKFTNAYFDYNSSTLKEEMKKEIEAFIPIYAASLFENKKFAKSISSVEIVGSASPSYNGKYINPRAVASVDEQNAMNYNLDLSYRRAKKIFEHTFFSKSFKFAHREEMMPIVKVTGTGYLQALEELKELPGAQQDKSKGFCGQYNCQTYQKVTLKFNLKDQNR